MLAFSKLFWNSISFVGLLVVCMRPVSAELLEYSAGHADIGLAYDLLDGLFLHYHFGAGAILDGAPVPSSPPGGIEVGPADAYVRLSDSTKVFVPGDVPFLGLNANESLWILQQGNASGQPFLGLASEELDPVQFNSAGFRLTDLRGPAGGNFALWAQSGFTSTIFMQSNNGVNPSQDVYNAAIGGHDHANFGFTKEGVYELDIQGFASGPSGSFSDSGTFRFVVGSSTAVPEPSSFTLLIAVTSFRLLFRRRLA